LTLVACSKRVPWDEETWTARIRKPHRLRPKLRPFGSDFPEVSAGVPGERQRPDIRAAKARLLAANARLGVAKADLKPRFVVWVNRFTGECLLW